MPDAGQAMKRRLVEGMASAVGVALGDSSAGGTLSLMDEASSIADGSERSLVPYSSMTQSRHWSLTAGSSIERKRLWCGVMVQRFSVAMLRDGHSPRYGEHLHSEVVVTTHSKEPPKVAGPLHHLRRVAGDLR